MKYFEGIKYECTAHYPLIADKVIEVVNNRDTADAFMKRHNSHGANVAIVSIKWIPQRTDLVWSPARG